MPPLLVPCLCRFAYHHGGSACVPVARRGWTQPQQGNASVCQRPGCPAFTPFSAGARDGQRKNFESLRKVLSQFTTVSEPAVAGEAAPAAAAAPTAEAAPPAAPAGEPVPAAGILETVVGVTACQRLQPWADLLHARLSAAVPALGELVPPSVLLGLLGTICLLTTLRLIIDMLAFVRNASAAPRDAIGLLTSILFTVSLLLPCCAGAA